jgi:molybdate transport system substrate-binding protein
VNAKATVIPSGLTGELAARGEVEVADPAGERAHGGAGIDIVGPLPAELDAVTVFSGALFAASPRRGAGMALLKFLSSPEAAPIYRRKGLEPLGRAGPAVRAGPAQGR